MRKLLLRAAAALPLLAFTLSATFPDPPAEASAPPAKAVAVLAGGCFWGMEGVFEHVKGVTATEVGYAGGARNTAHYEMVSRGDTGHAESVRITYDPSRISYGTLLKIYFSVAHDPTTLNRQHYDEGPQYRSSIFYADDQQKRTAEAYIRQLDAAHVFHHPIVTKVVPLEAFYPAEEHHQKFMDWNPTYPYIVAMDVPILENFRKTYPQLYK